MTVAGNDLVDELVGEVKSLQLSTINADGSPHLATMWFGVLGDDIVFWTQKASKKAANLRRDPRIACLVEAGEDYAVIRGASISATAELVTDRDQLVAIGHAIMERNFPAEGRPDPEPLVDSGNRVGIVVRPTHIATWDYRGKAGAGPKA